MHSSSYIECLVSCQLLKDNIWSNVRKPAKLYKKSIGFFFTHFDCPIAKNSNSVLSTWVRSDGKNSKIFTWRVFCAGTSHQWCVKFPCSIFLPVLVTMPSKIPVHYFRPGCDQKPCSVLSTIVRLFPYLGTFDQWCDQWGLNEKLHYNPSM